MLINCKYCNSKFAINAEEVGFDGRLVKCENCNKEWFQESKSQSLEKKLIELDQNLHSTEVHLIEKKNTHNDKIAKLENALANAKPEQVEKLTRAVSKNQDRVKAAQDELEQARLNVAAATTTPVNESGTQ